VAACARRGRPAETAHLRARHTAITTWLAAGITLYEVARFAGTSARMIDLTYGHLFRGSEASARAKLDAYASRLGQDRATAEDLEQADWDRKPAVCSGFPGWAVLGSNIPANQHVFPNGSAPVDAPREHIRAATYIFGGGRALIVLGDLASILGAAFTALAAAMALLTVLIDLRRQRRAREPNVSAGYCSPPSKADYIDFANAGPGLAVQLGYYGVASGGVFAGIVGSGHLFPGA
jgi:hypothetical protein